jgi:hypothetical protein
MARWLRNFVSESSCKINRPINSAAVLISEFLSQTKRRLPTFKSMIHLQLTDRLDVCICALIEEHQTHMILAMRGSQLLKLASLVDIEDLHDPYSNWC